MLLNLSYIRSRLKAVLVKEPQGEYVQLDAAAIVAQALLEEARRPDLPRPEPVPKKLDTADLIQQQIHRNLIQLVLKADLAKTPEDWLAVGQDIHRQIDLIQNIIYWLSEGRK